MMAAPPGEIALINRNGAKFWAHYTGSYSLERDSYQYRLNGSELVVVYIKGSDLIAYCRSNKPVPMPTC